MNAIDWPKDHGKHANSSLFDEKTQDNKLNLQLLVVLALYLDSQCHSKKT